MLILIGVVVILLVSAKFAHTCCKKYGQSSSPEIEVVEKWAAQRKGSNPGGKITNANKKKKDGLKPIKFDPHVMVDIEDQHTEEDEYSMKPKNHVFSVTTKPVAKDGSKIDRYDNASQMTAYDNMNASRSSSMFLKANAMDFSKKKKDNKKKDDVMQSGELALEDI